jgi:hypothetical protein
LPITKKQISAAFFKKKLSDFQLSNKVESLNDKYVELFLEPIRKCKEYNPKLGESQNTEGVSLESFLELYGSDLFYSWIGLDSSLMYAAHKAAGGMTSIYRQIGVGCERLFREIIIDTAQYSDI